MKHSSAPTFEGKPVLAAVDLSERSLPCLRYGCEMASKLNQPLILAHVVHETAETAGMYRRYHRGSDTTPFIDIARTMLEELVSDFREACDDLDGVGEVRLVVVEGIPETRIAELAEYVGAGMIVLCSQHRRGLSHWLHPSVAESVFRQTERPIVVVGHDGNALTPLGHNRPLRQAAAVTAGG